MKAVTCTHVTSPSTLYLDKALAAMEGTETANVLEWERLRQRYYNYVERVIILFE
jgi:hypothetical protein